MHHIKRILSRGLIAIIFPMSACSLSPNELTPLSKTIFLDSGWSFSQLDENSWLPAKVPGTVHGDLMKNGIIPDPHYRLNENEVQWIENKDWVYRTTFPGLDMDHVELIFDGLDTYAEVYLNDQLILESDNMFIGHRVDVREQLRPEENDLKIIFRSPVKMGMKKLQQLDYRVPAINEQAPEDERTNVFTRKAPFHYGWDWGPRLVTSGIWRPVILKGWDKACIRDVYIVTHSADEDMAYLTVQAEVEIFQPGTYHLGVNINGEPVNVGETVELNSGMTTLSFDFEMSPPKLWWTNGLGEPYLYDFSVSLSRNHQFIDRYDLKYGVRTIKLVQEPDDAGRSFYFELNGIPVFMKGANVIPAETLTPSVSEDIYHRYIKDAVKANMNMLRVWGGAIYEEEIFYNLCDQNGILVWQDFMFACALQPGDEEHLENIRREAEYNVKRLRNHACLALWCGNNENFHGWHEWGWKEMYEPDIRDFMWKSYERIFHEILPQAVEEYAPHTAYWPSSPMSYDYKKADRRSGDEHDWTIWFGQRPFSAYGDNVPRFVSEYGLQAFPDMHTIRKFSEKDDRDINSEVMRHRQRGIMEYIEPGFDGNDMIKRYMGRYYQIPEKFEDFVYVSQLLHAKAYKTAIEAHRRNMPHCMGSLYWQLNDSWPTISWATVDYYGRWKAAHYAVKKANEEIILSVEVKNNTGLVFVVSDRLSPVENARLSVRVMEFNGREIYSDSQIVQVLPNTSTLIMESDLEELNQFSDLTATVVKLELTKDNVLLADQVFYFHEPKYLHLVNANIAWKSERTERGYSITLSSNVLARNVYLDTPYHDVFFSDNYFDLLPGMDKTIELLTERTIDLEDDLIITTLNNIY